MKKVAWNEKMYNLMEDLIDEGEKIGANVLVAGFDEKVNIADFSCKELEEQKELIQVAKRLHEKFIKYKTEQKIYEEKIGKETILKYHEKIENAKTVEEIEKIQKEFHSLLEKCGIDTTDTVYQNMDEFSLMLEDRK